MIDLENYILEKKSEPLKVSDPIIGKDKKHYYQLPDECRKKEGIKETDTIYPIALEDIANCIDKAINNESKDGVKGIIKIFNECNISNLLTKSMGRIFETCLCKSMETCGGFSFFQGSEGANQKDIECKDNHHWSIELKTSQTFNSGINITGNKSYAKDEQDSHKDKNSFYILINYKFNKTSDKNNDASIGEYKAWFGYILQSDWSIYKADGTTEMKGNTSRLNSKAIVNRLVEIKTKY